MCLTMGFYQKVRSKGMICKLQKSINGLKHASRQRFSKFIEALLSFGFTENQNGHSVFIYSKDDNFLVLLVYVDDVVLTGTSATLIDQVKELIHSEFKIKDVGHLSYFLGLEVVRSKTGLFLNQCKCALAYC